MNKKIIIIFLILIILINIVLPVARAAEITKADLINDHKINTHIKFYNSGDWYDIKCGYICYKIDGEKYPAYCISHGIHGVDEEGSYTVKTDKLLDNKLIYNTILNGYPYKTPAQLGVENEDDAYVATKHAVNSVLLERDVKTFYKAADSKGEKIINAIYAISEKGKVGNEININSDVNISKIGDLVESGNYYYQEYNVTADRNISEYTVDNIIDFPEGTFVANTSEVPNTKFNSTEKFKIMIPKEKINKDISGNIEVIATCNTKPIFYGEAPGNNIQNYAITYRPYGEYKANNNVDIKTNTGSIKILKKDKENLKPIKDVTFGLYGENNELITKLKTNNDGDIIFKNLHPGTYKLKEEIPNDNYIKKDEIYNINVEYNKQAIKEITNEHKKGSLKITKVDKDNNSITLGAIEFDLIDENRNIIQHLITDVNGEVNIQNINTGNYTIKETKTKREYNLCIDNDITVEWNKNSQIVIENEKKKGKIKITKVDEDDNTIKLEGVVFEILDDNNRIVDKVITDKNGEAITSRLIVGKYKIREVSLVSNTDYILNNQEYILNVEDNEINEICIGNKHKKGKLEIKKVDKDDNTISLDGIEIDLIDSNGYNVQHLITDVNGKIYIDNINIGNYTLKETKTKNEYNICTNKNIVIEWNKTSKILIENEKKKGQIEIYKTNEEDDKEKINGAQFNILDNNGKVVDELITDQYGYDKSILLPIGEYYIKEIKTDNRYILEENITKVNIKDKEIITLNVTNRKKKGKIEITKTSSEYSHILNKPKGFLLSGVTFEIYNKNDKLIDTLTTNENGQALSIDLEIGRYKIKEKSTIKGYLLNNNEYIANITENGQIEKINIENDPIIPLVEIEKIGQQFAEKNEEIKYEFNIKNKSNTNLDKCTWKEYIPYKQVKVSKLITGTYSEKIDYQIYYKTNQSDYILLKEANTFKSEYIDLELIKLNKNEIIIEIKAEFENINKDFKSIISPIIFAQINNNVKSNEKIENYTEIIGSIQEYQVKDKSIYETIIKEKEIIKKLPKTGC